ncbi:MAG: right-handed parallel beta-helix repeat-containing protein, partial [Chloroflexi bacterium]|nr:right-handed parallel beta-helix repeat-containing protein [Chloroflexota bacterium]
RRAIVNIHRGTYVLNGALLLGPTDSQVTWKNHEGDDVRIISGIALTHFSALLDFSHSSDQAAAARVLDSALQKRIVKLNLSVAMGITSTAKDVLLGDFRNCIDHNPPGVELFFAGEPMPLARWPNAGLAPVECQGCNQTGADPWFPYYGSDPMRWISAVQTKQDAWVSGYWNSYCHNYTKLSDIHQQSVSGGPSFYKITTTATPSCTGTAGYTLVKGFRVFNLLEELDEEGEWYVDRATGMLYFYPPNEVSINDEQPVYISMPDRFTDPLEASTKGPLKHGRGHLLVIKEAQEVVIEGITFEFARDTAIVAILGEHNRVVGCTLRNLGGYGVLLNNSYGSAVQSCDIYNTNGGIMLRDNPGGSPGKMKADNNHIFNFSRWCRDAYAIVLEGENNTATHNRIHDGSGIAISAKNSGHLVSKNEIFNVVQESKDSGAFYIGRLEHYDTQVRWNYFHDVPGVGVYLDDYSSAQLVEGNVFVDVDIGVVIGGGDVNKIEGNIFVDTGKHMVVSDPLQAGSRGDYPWPCSNCPASYMNGMPDDNTFRSNVGYAIAGNKFKDVTIMFPGGASGNVVADNFDNYSVSPFIGFPSCSARLWLFQPQELAKLVAMGFQPIPLGQIGIYVDPWREFVECGVSGAGIIPVLP